METELASWHFFVAAALFAILGALFHVIRAVFNPFPDKLSDTPAVNILVSSDYSYSDYFWGVEFDDAGYYKLDSAKNLRLSVIFSTLGGILVMLFAEGADMSFAWMIEAGFGWLRDLWVLRWNEAMGAA